MNAHCSAVATITALGDASHVGKWLDETAQFLATADARIYSAP